MTKTFYFRYILAAIVFFVSTTSHAQQPPRTVPAIAPMPPGSLLIITDLLNVATSQSVPPEASRSILKLALYLGSDDIYTDVNLAESRTAQTHWIWLEVNLLDPRSVCFLPYSFPMGKLTVIATPLTSILLQHAPMLSQLNRIFTSYLEQHGPSLLNSSAREVARRLAGPQLNQVFGSSIYVGTMIPELSCVGSQRGIVSVAPQRILPLLPTLYTLKQILSSVTLPSLPKMKSVIPAASQAAVTAAFLTGAYYFLFLSEATSR